MGAVAAGEIRVVDNAPELRYEIWLGDAGAGFVAYRREPGTIVLIHTDIEPAFAGKGLGSRLVAGTLDDLRRRGLKVVPVCPFVAAYIRRHPEYDDLVVSDPAPAD
jgi:predicted GNAT family acetyltransferase